jgi:hypothetical protein
MVRAVYTKILGHMIDSVIIPESKEVFRHYKVFINFVFIKGRYGCSDIIQVFERKKVGSIIIVGKLVYRYKYPFMLNTGSYRYPMTGSDELVRQ